MLAYLSRYTHRVAISNSRLIAADAAQRHVQGQGLPDRRPRPLQDHDARRRRVHPPLPHPRAAEGLPSHPPLRPVRQRATAPRPSRERANCSPWRRPQPKQAVEIDPAAAPAARPALPVLRRPHDHHRDLRARLPAAPPADRASRRHQDRHLMSAAAASRTRIAERVPRWSSTRPRRRSTRQLPGIAFHAAIVPEAIAHRS